MLRGPAAAQVSPSQVIKLLMARSRMSYSKQSFSSQARRYPSCTALRRRDGSLLAGEHGSGLPSIDTGYLPICHPCGGT